MTGTWQEEYDALSARIGATYDLAQSMGATVEYGSTPALKLMRFELWFMTTDGLKHMLLVPARKGS